MGDTGISLCSYMELKGRVAMITLSDRLADVRKSEVLCEAQIASGKTLPLSRSL